jgi:hypothetical protein
MMSELRKDDLRTWLSLPLADEARAKWERVIAALRSDAEEATQ